jgi:hypothetical protein
MTKNVQVTFDISVTVDKSKFTQEFIDNFAKYFFELESIDQHIEHIAELAAKDRLDEFTEGYGQIKDMGISARINDIVAEVEG